MYGWMTIAAVLLLVDTAARRLGVYGDAQHDWPTGWRAERFAPADPESPYRVVDRVAWRPVIAAGIPRAVSIPLLLVLGLSLAWSLCSVLALGDLADVVRGTRTLGRVLASLGLCIARASTGWVVLGAALTQRRARFAVAIAVALTLDAALYALPLPCSDVRADDVNVARWGLVADVSLALGFALSAWARRGLDFTDPATRPRSN